MHPVEALERIAYLLERAREPTHRVRAFRRAAEVVRGLATDDLRAMADAGQLRSLPGIGESTERVIAEALGGGTPSYLARLEDQPEAVPDPEAVAVRDALKGDCHGHSDWSDGGSPIEEMARAATALGHHYWALTDHSGRLKVARGLDAARLRSQLGVVEALNSALEAEGCRLRVLTGIEVDILDDGQLDQDRGLLAELDVVVASAHSKLRMDNAAMTKRLVAAASDPLVDILGHCTGRLVTGRGRPESQFDAGEVFAACAAAGTAVEVNSRPERLDPPMRLLGQAAEAGCLFAVDTDAHAPGQLEWLMNGCERVARAGIPSDRIVNSWALEDFLAWSRG